jgi:hypothetical protein
LVGVVNRYHLNASIIIGLGSAAVSTTAFVKTSDSDAILTNLSIASDLPEIEQLPALLRLDLRRA